MKLGKTFRSFFRPGIEEHAGWAVTIQAHLDLKRQIVYVCVADEPQATAIALEAVAGLITERKPVPLSVLTALGVQHGQYKLQTGNGWSFSIQNPTGVDKKLVIIYLSDQHEAEAVALKIVDGTVLLRSEVPPSVIADLGLLPGGAKVL